jgi:hypothetical protein
MSLADLRRTELGEAGARWPGLSRPEAGAGTGHGAAQRRRLDRYLRQDSAMQLFVPKAECDAHSLRPYPCTGRSLSTGVRQRPSKTGWVVTQAGDDYVQRLAPLPL